MSTVYGERPPRNQNRQGLAGEPPGRRRDISPSPFLRRQRSRKRGYGITLSSSPIWTHSRKTPRISALPNPIALKFSHSRPLCRYGVEKVGLDGARENQSSLRNPHTFSRATDSSLPLKSGPGRSRGCSPDMAAFRIDVLTASFARVPRDSSSQNVPTTFFIST